MSIGACLSAVDFHITVFFWINMLMVPIMYFKQCLYIDIVVFLLLTC